MKIHIIVFCQDAPKGETPPPQWASMVVTCEPSCISSSLGAAQPPGRASLEGEQQEEKIEPESGQEVPVCGEQAQAVAAGRVGQAPDSRQHDGEPDQTAQQMHAVQPGEDVEERAVR